MAPILDTLVAETSAGAKTSPKPRPPVGVGRLDTLERVRREAVRLYTSGRLGQIPATDASRLASVLQLIAVLLRDRTLDGLAERVEALEARAS